MAARLLLALLWAFHWLPLAVQAAIGRGLGTALYALVGKRRRIALRNLELCFPALPAAERVTLCREHFKWLAAACWNAAC